MADDPGDPLAGWQPSAGAPVAATDPTPPPPPPPKSALETAYDRLPSAAGPGRPRDSSDVLGPVTSDVTALRGAFGEGYRSVPESVTRPGERSVFTPETQTQISRWPYGTGTVTNAVGDVLGTGIAGIAGVGNSALALGNAALGSTGMPPRLQRDINLAATMPPDAPRGMPVDDRAAIRELTAPPAPSVYDVWKQQRAITPPDPVTAAVNTLLRRSVGTADMPAPPAPFKGAPYQPPPSGGLVGVPPSPPGTGFARAPVPNIPAMPAADIRTIAEGYYSPADKAAAQGVMIPADSANGIRGVLTDAVPTDPQKAIGVGNTPLVQLGKDYQQFQGQPMSVDAAMALDRRLTAEKQTAYGANNKTLAGQISDAQDAIREKMFATPEMQSVPQALQAYTQYVKQSQMEDLAYRAGLLPDDKQGPYLKSQLTTMLRGKQMASWSPEERAAAEQVVQSGNIGALKNFGITLIKPFGQSVGGYVGSAFGPGGTYVGALAGGELATPFQAKLRAALQKITLDKIQQQITAGVPPPSGQ